MSIRVICLGKNKDKNIENNINEFLKRTSPYTQIKFDILLDIKLTKTQNIDLVKSKEAEIIKKRLNKNEYIIVLDERGKQFTSPAFSKLLESKLGHKDICFIIGGVYGLDESILKLADLKLSFSNFTFTHLMIRLLLIEQIYRAFTIMKGKKYHY